MLPDWGLVKEFLQRLLELSREHVSSLLTGGGAVLAALWAWWRAEVAWKKRRFLHRVNFSLNYLDGNMLRFRTLRECDIGEVLLNNKHAVKLVTKAAQRTTLEAPVLELPRGEAWVVLNSVLNELSEQFAVGFLAASLQIPVKRERFVIGLTCEKDPDVRINKIRVMLIAEGMLDQVDAATNVTFEREQHHVRLKTLKKMAQFRRDKSRQHNLLQVELALPAA